MNKQEIMNEIKKDTNIIESFIKNLQIYCIEEENEIDIPTTMIPALDIIIENINKIKNNLNKLKND